MRFKKLRIKNLRSYRDEEIIFPEGSLLISGDVGSGKTSILLALEYALFGLQPGQKGSLLLRNDSKAGEVELEMDISGRTVSIERKLKRTPKGVTNEYASLTTNDEKWESSVTEIKSKIFSLLGYPPEIVKKNNALYRYTVYSPQEQMKNIILEDSETRLNLLRHIFGIDKYKHIAENSAVLIATLKNESRVMQAQSATLEKDAAEVVAKKIMLGNMDEKIVLSENNLEEKILTRKLIEKSFEELKLKIDERRKFNEEMEKTKLLLSTKKENIFSLAKEKGELVGTIATTQQFNEQEYRAVASSLAEKKQKIEFLLSENAEIRGKLRALEQTQANTTEKQERIFKMKFCPTCLQDVSEVHKHNILNEAENALVQTKKEREQLSLKLHLSFEQTDKLKKEVSLIEEKKLQLEIIKTREEHIEKSKSKLKEIEKNIHSFEEDIILLTKHLEGLKEKFFEYSVFEQQSRKKEEEVRAAHKAEKNAEIESAEMRKELEFLKREIFALEKNVREKELLRQRLREMNDLSDWLAHTFLTLVGSIERNVLFKVRAEFSSLFRKWFSMLIQENTLEAHIDETFTPVIIQGEAEMEYDFLSGGERTAIALAYRLALNQTINSLLSKLKTRGIIILDEPTDGFSDTQIEKMRDILEELNAEQLIIVSHEQKIESFVDNIIRVSKDGTASQIEPQQHTAVVNI